MKRHISMLLAVVLVFTGLCFGTATVQAAKPTESRAIAIVFDNSGSMYIDGASPNQAWCRATYAMEVFASMLNAGDTLLIYPMHPITVGGKEYTMENPYKINGASQATTIRDIYTPDAKGTPIESVDAAVQGIQNVSAGKKYVIVLTDGDSYSHEGHTMRDNAAKEYLDNIFNTYTGPNMTGMYLGIGKEVLMPTKAQNEYFVSRHAIDSNDVLSSLTEMCNMIFGRDTLPKNRISGKNVSFDISMKRLIVFVQGGNLSDLKLVDSSGKEVGTKVSSTTTKYSTAGCGTYESVPDSSLQGMMVTYDDCAAGDCTLQYNGNATSIEVYYEPNADLDFVFTDEEGNTVDPNALYEGNYMVSFGMKDAKTGKLISSDLLGKTKYQGSYSVNGTQYPITCDGYNGSVPVALNMGDSFEAQLTVTYLSGYTITKDSTDFGWPKGGINVVARPAGELKLEISGGSESYSLQKLLEGAPFVAKVFYKGQQLTGDALKSAPLVWNAEGSNAAITTEFADDHYIIKLGYKDPSNPQGTVCGECSVPFSVSYTEQGSTEAKASATVAYNIIDDFSPLQLELVAPQDYIVISDLEKSQIINVNLKMNGAKLTAEEFARVELTVDCGGIQHTVTPVEKDSCYTIKLNKSDGISEGDYVIKVNAAYTDHIGRTTYVDDSSTITLSTMPLWLKWTIRLLILLLIIILILIIMHIKVLPKRINTTKRDSTMIFDGEDATKSTAFTPKLEKGQLILLCKYAGTKTGLAMDVKPGKESYLKKSQVRRSAEVRSNSVRKYGTATVTDATIGSIKYVLNEDNGKLERVPKNEKPFELKHGMRVSYSGTMMSAGTRKPFTVTTKLNFKKK